MTMAIQTDNNSYPVSLVIPMYNEEDNVAPMMARIHEALADYPHPWELIIVDDGSTDRTEAMLASESTKYGDHVRIITLQRNFGQTAALQAGIDHARGDIIATLDGDLQNDPGDIPRMINRLLDENLDLVAGWRQSRQDNLVRRIPSLIANRLIGWATGIELHDYGCTLKVYRASIIKGVRLYGEMHRFIPAWVASTTSSARIKEEVVNHHARKHGQSKYNIFRTYRVVLDLLSVYFFMRFRSRPSHFFGRIGFIFGILGMLCLGYLFIDKFLFGADIGTRPLLLIGVLFIVMAAQFLTTGVLSEMIVRTYYESSDTKAYIVRSPNADQIAEGGWKQM